jgi:hypothetical protein
LRALWNYIKEILAKMQTAAQLRNLKNFPKGYHSGNHTQKGPYLTCLLKRLIEKKIRYEDPETQKMIKGTVKDALIWRYILNGCQGETQAIEGILDRIDGKVNGTPLVDQSSHYHFTKLEGEKLVAEAQRRGIPIPTAVARRFRDTRKIK